ncbi:hypothetical protein CPB83DRAFT_864255 [Crepidotus variabilis]|uniref:Uncharacterized protein n=1 Tax=Crepidotus variabilis TaxID=179855 RepID=A0A9P6JJ25_9AGAR|nr:hypothetical protein CPB83DRAFT_864255 [Crepidotus variabilis]
MTPTRKIHRFLLLMQFTNIMMCFCGFRRLIRAESPSKRIAEMSSSRSDSSYCFRQFFSRFKQQANLDLLTDEEECSDLGLSGVKSKDFSENIHSSPLRHDLSFSMASKSFLRVLYSICTGSYLDKAFRGNNLCVNRDSLQITVWSSLNSLTRHCAQLPLHRSLIIRSSLGTATSTRFFHPDCSFRKASSVGC